ncbi:MAG: sigma-70 family RNA polymerase sigma factor [Gemmataceae bacterium]
MGEIEPERENSASFLDALEAARGGSNPALGAMLDSCRAYIAAIAGREVPVRLQGRVSPSSLVQETYLRACRKFPQFRGDSERQLMEWLRTILLRCLINLLRKPEFRQSMSGLPAELAAVVRSPNEAAGGTERDRKLTSALDDLPTRYRLAIELRHFDELTFEEIGHVLGTSSEAARKHWARGLAKLGEKLQTLK